MIETVKEQSVQEIQSLEVPETVLAWRFPCGMYMLDHNSMEISVSERGIGIAAKRWFGCKAKGTPIESGCAVKKRFPEGFPNAGIGYPGFVLYDDNGIEITRFRAS